MIMDEFQMLMAVIAINASVLGVAFLVLYGFNKAVSGTGR
jgi:hypothetical protein